MLANLLGYFPSKMELFRNRKMQLLKLPHLDSLSYVMEIGWRNRPDVCLLTSAEQAFHSMELGKIHNIQ